MWSNCAGGSSARPSRPRAGVWPGRSRPRSGSTARRSRRPRGRRCAVSIEAPSGKKKAGNLRAAPRPSCLRAATSRTCRARSSGATPPLGVDVADEAARQPEARVRSNRSASASIAPGQGIGVVVEHQQQFATRLPDARLRPAIPRFGLLLEQLGRSPPRRPDELGRVVLGAVVHDEHLVHGELGQAVEHGPSASRRFQVTITAETLGALGSRGALARHDEQVYVRTMRAP